MSTANSSPPAAPAAEHRRPFLERRDRPGVVHVFQHREPSGAEVAHLPLLLAEPDALLVCPPDSATDRFARERGIRTAPLPYRTLRQSAGSRALAASVGRGLRSAGELRRLLRRYPDRPLIVGNTLTPSLLATVATVGMRRRPVWVVAQFMPRAHVREPIRLLARLRRPGIVVPSRAVRTHFVAGSRRLARRTRVVHPGIDLTPFAAHERLSPDADGAAPSDNGARSGASTHRVALIGYVAPVKRTELALDIARRVAAEVPDFELLIVGSAQFTPEDFAYERAMRERVAGDELLRQHVRFCGYERDVAARLASVAVLLHCCPVETFGMVLVEAMAAGCAVVAPAGGGALDIVEPGVTGLLYPPPDAARAAAHLVDLLRDPAAAATMGRAGRARAERLFSQERYVTRFSAALEEFASG